VDFGLAVLTFEAAGMVIRLLLLRGLVGNPTFGACEYHCRLRSAGHPGSMLPDSPVFQPGSRAQLRQQTASMSSDLSAPSHRHRAT